MPNRPSTSSDSSVNRRSFFRQILSRGIEQFEHAGREFAQRVAGPIEGVTGKTPTPVNTSISLQIRYLRPPGALPAPDFAQACSRCGDCAAACPAQCIVLDVTGKIADGRPYIIARESPCVVCDDLSCMKTCPSGALRLVDAVAQIDMGTAVVNDMTCLRGPRGPRNDRNGREDCRLCISHCPLGEAAIGIDPHQNVIEIRDGCIGCGLCEQACPTEPTSIWVEARVDYD